MSQFSPPPRRAGSTVAGTTAGTCEPPDLAAAAARAASAMVKTRARQLARRPLGLEALHPGLAAAAPATLIAVAAHLVERESRSPRRWFGFGGEVNLVSARAALLLGRARRRAARRQAGAG